MIDTMLRRVPLAAYRPLRQAVHDFPRGHPVRLAATVVLQHAARAFRNHLPGRLTEIRPLDNQALSFAATDSMVMDAVYWFGIRGYEGTVPRTWAALCERSLDILEVGGNVGLFTVVGAHAARGSYTVVEPVPGNAAVLRGNLARNAMLSVEVLEAAAIPGDQPRDVTLNVPDEGRDTPVGAHLLDGVEVSGRSTQSQITVPGLPMRTLAESRDLIKIDAEGIEAALLGDIRTQLVARRPTLLIEVLPEAVQLGQMLSALAVEAGYAIHVLPEYGSDRTVEVPPASFTSAVPKAHNSKDVVLSVGPLPG